MRIAVWQARGPDDGSVRLADAAARAAAAGADVLVTPELFSTGYAMPFGPPDPDLLPRVRHLAAEHHLALVVSEPHEGAITAVVVRPDGSVAGRYRKTHLWGDDERAAFTPGDGTPLITDVAGRRTAVVICYDVEFPEVVRGLALAGAEVLLVPTALDDPAVVDVLVPARAMENGMTIAYANQCDAASTVELPYRRAPLDAASPAFCGRSVVVGPDGRVVVQAGDDEELLIADVPTTRPGTDYLADRRPETYLLGRAERRGSGEW